jgi:hypothetical protein
MYHESELHVSNEKFSLKDVVVAKHRSAFSSVPYRALDAYLLSSDPTVLSFYQLEKIRQRSKAKSNRPIVSCHMSTVICMSKNLSTNLFGARTHLHSR